MECYLYYSFLTDEKDKHIKKIWEQHLELEISHLHAAKDLFEKYEKKQWEEVVPAEFPELLHLKPTKEYLRDLLDSQIELTANREDFVDVAALPEDHEYFQYQEAVHPDTDMVRSHIVIVEYQDQDEDGEDYRYEESEHPVEALADRTEDNTDIGRVPHARAQYEEANEDDMEDEDDEDEDDEEEAKRPAKKKKPARRKSSKS